MVQDFFAAFGQDEPGNKSSNNDDFSDVSLTAIPALTQKVETLEARNKALRYFQPFPQFMPSLHQPVK